jgi:hypothetical protein
VPALRIVDDDLWQAVKTRQGSIRASDGVAKAGLPGFGSADDLAVQILRGLIEYVSIRPAGDGLEIELSARSRK